MTYDEIQTLINTMAGQTGLNTISPTTLAELFTALNEKLQQKQPDNPWIGESGTFVPNNAVQGAGATGTLAAEHALYGLVNFPDEFNAAGMYIPQRSGSGAGALNFALYNFTSLNSGPKIADSELQFTLANANADQTEIYTPHLNIPAGLYWFCFVGAVTWNNRVVPEVGGQFPYAGAGSLWAGQIWTQPTFVENIASSVLPDNINELNFFTPAYTPVFAFEAG